MSGSKLLDDSSRRGAPEAIDQPLGLTVHSLPSPERAMDAEVRRTGRGRWQMLLVALVCAAPVIASYFTYYVLRPEGRRNFGELIEPQRPLPDQPTVRLDGQGGTLKALKGQWLLISVVWLIADDAAVPDKLLPALKEATVLRVAGGALGVWLQPESGHQLAEHLYLVDPMGNWMMRFPAQLDIAGAAKAKRDLERLLRASASWDQPGREPRPVTAK